MTTVSTTDPTTGRTAQTPFVETTPAQLEQAVADAVADAAALATAARGERADLLDTIAAGILAAKSSLVDTAGQETGLAPARLAGEVDRAAHQFGMFADVLREGSYLEVMVDHAEGAAPDVRRMLVPIGPVVVFGASNFPFAFSVLGGDTASAIAAGCSVLAKAHPAHPLTSALSASIVQEAAGVSVATTALQLIFGFQAGLDVVRHPAVRAVTLTGSLGAARGILEAIGEREDPIPLYGELSSINPLVVLPGAARARCEEIAAGLFSSFTGSGGQLCTKPGFAFIPRSEAGDQLVAQVRDLVEDAPEAVLLSSTIRDSFTEGVNRQIEHGAARVVAPRPATGAGFSVVPELLEIDIDDLRPAQAEECFGPVITLVRYANLADVVRALRELSHSLTVSIHADGEGDRAGAAKVLDAAVERTGRVVFDGYPTGVRVSWAQHHGGPWPSTNSQHTSVGATAIRRFLRPIAFQNAPQWALPAELRDDATDLPRRIDGRLLPG